jgi:hypothetical protein
MDQIEAVGAYGGLPRRYFRFTLKKRAQCCTAVEGESVPQAALSVE